MGRRAKADRVSDVKKKEIRCDAGIGDICNPAMV